MGIKDIILRLQKLEQKYGDIEVFFDCPHCGKLYKPNTITTQAIHFKADNDANKS